MTVKSKIRHYYDVRRVFKDREASDYEETLTRISELMRNPDTVSGRNGVRSNKMELCRLMFEVLTDDVKELRKR